MDKEDEEMRLAANSTNKLSNHPKFKSRVPRLNVVKGIAQANAADPIQRKWFEEFKK
ncbi:hypothetical protein [Aneurinibacillus terranovensis]|uniref:hypothetical protein n=1 Tax=Aneurinibacillus terranovensis TaxID=278991 RepID=UPI000427985A|nr:hypothetical protein [Aneurinibacillus terranovensis]